ncbi:MAG: WD40 repeat domain-containing protein, partial [Chryseobacterium sp.]
SGTNKQIKVWKLHSEVNTIKNHTKQVNTVIISSDNKTIASGSFDGTIKVYDYYPQTKDLSTNPKNVLNNVHNGWVYTLAISPDNKTLVSGGADNTIKIWDLERLKNNQESKPKYTLTEHKDKVSTLVITPDGKQLISGSHDKTIKIWNLKGLKDNQPSKLTLSDLNDSEGHKDWISCLAVTQDNKFLVSGSLDGTIKIWNLENKSKPEPINTISINRRINSLAISHDGKILVSGDSGNTIKIWEIKTWTLEELKNLKSESATFTFTDHEDDVYSLAISSDNKLLVSGSADNTIKIWDLERLNKRLNNNQESKPYLTFSDHQGPIDTIAISNVRKNNYIIVSGSSDNTIKVRPINLDNQQSIKKGCKIIGDYFTTNKNNIKDEKINLYKICSDN